MLPLFNIYYKELQLSIQFFVHLMESLGGLTSCNFQHDENTHYDTMIALSIDDFHVFGLLDYGGCLGSGQTCICCGRSISEFSRRDPSEYETD